MDKAKKNLTLREIRNDSKRWKEEDEMADRKQQIADYADKSAKTYQDIALAIHAKPEVSDFEFFASKTLSGQLDVCEDGRPGREGDEGSAGIL